MEPAFNVTYFLIDSRLSDNHYFPGNLHLRLFRIECSMINLHAPEDRCNLVNSNSSTNPTNMVAHIGYAIAGTLNMSPQEL
jgi:hypothetical protein